MQFVLRSSCPNLLTKKQAEWTTAWVSHYCWEAGINNEIEQPKKPTSSHWLLDEIRLPLIRDFHNNCGYCGESLPTPQNEANKAHASKGDIDHFLPKAIYPDQVYLWTNYVWSCKPCNQLKKEFHSVDHPLFNPCCEEDCEQLNFDEETGLYALQPAVANDKDWQQRLKNSEQKTMLNAEEICKKRRLRISTLRRHFSSINRLPYQIQTIKTEFPDIANQLQEQINEDIAAIREILTGPDFYNLLQKQYETLLLEYPQIAEMLK